jgi:hypothetical protein
LNIIIEEPNRAKKSTFYVGSNSRLATLTDVCFMPNNHLITAHLVGECLHYLKYDFDDKTSSVLNSIESTFDGVGTIVDLIKFDGLKRIIASNFDAGSATLYELSDGEIKHLKDIALPEGKGNCHGASFFKEDIICLSTNKNFLFFINIHTEEILAEFSLPYHIKDMCTYRQNELLLCFAIKSPNSQVKPTYGSGIYYVRVDIEKNKLSIIDKRYFWPAAFDAICIDKNTNISYVTDQYGCRVISFTISKGKIAPLGEYRGFDFPHGVDINKSILAITNYGNSSLDLLDIEKAFLEAVSGKHTGYRKFTFQEVKSKCIYYIKRIFEIIGILK